MRKAWIAAMALALAGCTVGADLPLARTGVDALHAAYNSGQCPHIRETAAPDFQRMTPVESWQAVCTQLTNGLGKFVSLKQIGWNDEYTNGDHLIRLSYDTEFEKGKATEQFLFRIAGAEALLVGYHVNSDVFNAPPAPPAAEANPRAAPAPK